VIVIEQRFEGPKGIDQRTRMQELQRITKQDGNLSTTEQDLRIKAARLRAA